MARMKRVMPWILLLIAGASQSRAGWTQPPPPYTPLNAAFSVSVGPQNWNVSSSNEKVQVAWVKDPSGVWHPGLMAVLGHGTASKDFTGPINLHLFSLPGVWAVEVVVQAGPVGSAPPSSLIDVLAGPTSFMVGAPTPTPTPTPTRPPTPSPTPTPTPTPTEPTPTPSPTPPEKLFK